MKFIKSLGHSIAAVTIAAILALIIAAYAPDISFDRGRHASITPVLAQLQYPLGPYANLGFSVAAQNVTATVPAFQMVGIVTGSTAAAETLTTDTATNLCTLFPFVGAQTTGASNFAWDWYVKNTGATNAITVAAGAGVTLIGTGTAAALNVRHFKIQLTNCPPFGLTSPTPAVNLYSLETALF